MRRRLLNLLTVLSLLLCVAMMALWVRSHFVQDSVRNSTSDRRMYGLSAYRGTLILSRTDLSPDSVIARTFRQAQWDSHPVTPEHGSPDYGDSTTSIIWRNAGWLGFGTAEERFVEGVIRAVVVPFWFIAATCILLPAAHALAGIRRRTLSRVVPEPTSEPHSPGS
jgi:hypothetical protein